MLPVIPRRGGQAHVATIRTKGKGGTVYTSYLLRRSYREGGKVRHENLGNLSHLPPGIIEAIRRMLAGRVLVDLEEQFEIESSLPHGHVAAVLGVLRELDLERLFGAGALPRAGPGGGDDLPAGDRARVEVVDDPAVWADNAV